MRLRAPVHALVRVRNQGLPPLLSILHFDTRSVTEPKAPHFGEAGWLVGSQDLPASASIPVFYLGAGDLNSGFLAFSASVLPHCATSPVLGFN